MKNVIEKVTAFITQNRNQKTELLLIQHPNAGIQIPAGTVENGETVEQALKREITEETGLKHITIKNYIGYMDITLPDNQFMLLGKSKVYSRPNLTSFDWAELRKGVQITANRTIDDYTQISYVEYDRYPNPEYVTYNITGWVPTNILCKKSRRHFFHVLVNEELQEEWELIADNHIFKLFWSPLVSLPQIVDPQDQWLEFVKHDLGYNLE